MTPMAFYSKDFTITQAMIDAFGEASGDFNPIHYDEFYAQQTRFGGRIVHGMLIGGFISACLTDHYGPGTIYLGQTLKFLAPVRPGDTVTIEFRYEASNNDPAQARKKKLQTVAIVNDTEVLTGVAEILKPQ